MAELPEGHQLLLYAAGPDRMMTWDPRRDRIRSPSPAIHYLPACQALSPDGRCVAYREEYDIRHYRILIVNTDHLIERPDPIPSPEPVEALAFDPAGRTLAGACADHRVRLWDVDSGENLLALKAPRGAYPSVAFFPDGRTLAALALRPEGGTEVFLWRTAPTDPASTTSAPD